jgi:hypothetical protein
MLLMEGVYCLASHRTVVMYLEIIRIAFTLTTAPESQLLAQFDWLFKIRIVNFWSHIMYESLMVPTFR